MEIVIGPVIPEGFLFNNSGELNDSEVDLGEKYRTKMLAVTANKPAPPIPREQLPEPNLTSFQIL